MNLDFTKKLYDDLMEEISLFNEMGITSGRKLTGKLNSIRNALAKLRQNMLDHPFATAGEEITFFKSWKPLFLARHYYETELFKIQTHQPAEDNELKDYLLNELAYVQQFADKHQFFYQYFITESSELDNYYFLRNATPLNLLWTEPLGYDPEFGTPGDSLFARFLCNSWLKTYLLQAIRDIGKNSSTGRPFDLTWTGEKQNLIELAYGLWLARPFNGGNATLVQVIAWLEQSLQVDLGNVQKAFANIRSRKRLSQTKFIDLLKEEILKKIDEDLR